MKYKKTVLFSITLLIITTTPSFAQEENSCDLADELICIKTDKDFYSEDDIIVISGKVKAVILDSPVALQIFYEDTMIQIDQLSVAQDGTFATTLVAKGPQWKNDGTYLVRSSYSGETNEVNFDFQTKTESVSTSEIFEVDAGDSGTFDVEYEIRGGTIKDILIEPEIFGLITIIEAERDGSITLNLPRESIDAKKNDGMDESFIIFIDGSEVSYQEKSDSESRVITFQFEEGDSDIEIIGTFVVPEFGTIAALILAVAIISIITISIRTKLLIKI